MLIEKCDFWHSNRVCERCHQARGTRQLGVQAQSKPQEFKNFDDVKAQIRYSCMRLKTAQFKNNPNQRDMPEHFTNSQLLKTAGFLIIRTSIGIKA